MPLIAFRAVGKLAYSLFAAFGVFRNLERSATFKAIQWVDEEKKKLDALKADYERNAATLTHAQKQARQKEFQEKAQAYQALLAGARKEVKESDAEQTRKVMEQMRQVIASVGKVDGYSLIVEKTSTSVLYSKDGMDLTGKVIRQMEGQK